MRRIPYISALMTAFPRHLEGAVSVPEARRFMLEHGIHHLPVSGAGETLRVVHYADLTDDRAARCIGELARSVPAVDARERADQVLDLMAREHAPVVLVLRQQRLSGIFTWTDACHHFARLLREPFLPPDGDEVA